MTAASSPQLKICPECGADCGGTAQSCWMCQANLANVETIVAAEEVANQAVRAVRRPPNAVSEAFFATSTILLVIAALVVGIGLMINEPGLGIVFAIVASPALIATVVRTRFRQATTGTVSWAERFATLIVSGALTIGILSMLGVACFVAFLAYCIVTNSGPNFH
jgi:hypothetical protein